MDPTTDQAISLAKARGAAIAGPADRADVVHVLDRAFVDDPNMVWMLRADRHYDWARRRLIDQVVGAMTLPLGQTYLVRSADLGPLACAAWQPPDMAGQKLSLWQMMRLAPDMVQVAGWSRLPRMLALIDTMEKHHPLAEPHFYLYFLGVDPRFQGKGLGSLTLEASLAPVDAAGLPAYLENSKPKNTPLYQRYGFEPGIEFRARADAPPLLPMWRPSRRMI